MDSSRRSVNDDKDQDVVEDNTGMSQVNSSYTVASTTQADLMRTSMEGGTVEPPPSFFNVKCVSEPPPSLVPLNEVDSDEENSKKKTKAGEASTSTTASDSNVGAGDSGLQLFPFGVIPTEAEIGMINERTRRFYEWLQYVQEIASFDTDAKFSDVSNESPPSSPRELISIQRQNFEELLELMYSDGMLERNNQQQHMNQGYFQSLAAILGSCSNILHGLAIVFQSEAVPRSTTISKSFKELSDHLLEGDIISLRESCRSSKTLLEEGNMSGLNTSLTDLFSKVKDAIRRVKDLLIVEEDIARLQSENLEDW